MEDVSFTKIEYVETGWQVHADIKIDTNTWSGPHFVECAENATDKTIKNKLLALYK